MIGPSWLAGYVYALAGGRITRETEHFLLWELPLSRGWQYYHAHRLTNGEETISLQSAAINTVKARLEHYRSMIFGARKHERTSGKTNA